MKSLYLILALLLLVSCTVTEIPETNNHTVEINLSNEDNTTEELDSGTIPTLTQNNMEDDFEGIVLSREDVEVPRGSKRDLWDFDPIVPEYDASRSYASAGASGGSPLSATESIGFAVGGAKDINNFRENIENDYFPLYSDLTYEGLFYDYYFDIGITQKCKELFCPTYTTARSKDPLSDEENLYLSIGLDSGITNFERKNLNLVIVLDISGSMGSPFSKYYYDSLGLELPEEADWTKTKMEIANEAVVELMKHLNPEDKLGIVLFESQAYEVEPITYVAHKDMDSLEEHIMEVGPIGGTNMESGYKLATEMLESIKKDSAYENRIIFLTDAQPNTGSLDTGLIGLTAKNAEKKIYTTFIGIGVDFNTKLIEKMTKTNGANYFSVHHSEEFKDTMDENFDFMVTPLIFDLELTLDSDNYEIEKVYGSPEADEATNVLMRVNTLFPSRKVDGEVKGGVVLLKLKKISEGEDLSLNLQYEDRDGKTYNSVAFVNIPEQLHFSNNGIRKAVLLTQYADLAKNWILDERQERERILPITHYRCGFVDGITVPPEDLPVILSPWERQSVKLTVSEHYRELFKEFATYYEEEMKIIDDETLEQEMKVMKVLS